MSRVLTPSQRYSLLIPFHLRHRWIRWQWCLYAPRLFLQTLDALEDFVGTVESGDGDARETAISEASNALKRLAGMRRSYNLEIKLLKDPASKVCHRPFIAP